jgi:hypothetical protein
MARSELVKSFRDGYGNMLHQEGMKVKRAKIFSEEKLNNLVTFLMAKLARNGSDGVMRGGNGSGSCSLPVRNARPRQGVRENSSRPD